eukprot:TRINITY_DN7748_c0_g2_i1.p1 TRINITY_DN7748_c0_g2~~TRINITY_DN7748_c0_g2_i1.p1  ORF type:complete len:351 (+),score=49.30 TRINITY_DN7748_c0_g2_i1:34-1086(+)
MRLAKSWPCRNVHPRFEQVCSAMRAFASTCPSDRQSFTPAKTGIRDHPLLKEDLAALIASKCPHGCAKIDEQALNSFRLRALGAHPTKSCSVNSVSERLSVVLDYDLTISAGLATEGHDLLRRSDELPVAFRKDCEAFRAVSQDVDFNTPHGFWTRFNKILIRHGVTAEMVDRAVAAEKRNRGLLLRDGVAELFNLCESHGIPVVVLSAGITQIIHCALRLEGITLPSNSSVVANNLVFDIDGCIVDVAPNDPPCSRQGKLEYLRTVEGLSGRPCVLLAGDKPIDALMASGYPALVDGGTVASLKFGFLNESEVADEAREEFETAFDVVPLRGVDCSFAPLTELLRALLS